MVIVSVCVCVLLCVLWCFFSSLCHSVGVFSIWNGTTDSQQPLLFVQFSAKMASSVTLPAPLQGDHNDEQARSPRHMHFTSSTRSDKISHQGCKRSGVPNVLCTELGGEPYTPPRGARPCCQCATSIRLNFQKGPRYISDTEMGPEKLLIDFLLYLFYFDCLFPPLSISPLLRIIKKNFTCTKHLYWARFHDKAMMNINT